MQKSGFTLFVRTPLALCLILLIGTTIFTKRGLGDWRRMVGENGELEVKIARLENQLADLERQTKALQSDPAAQERVIRRMMGYVKPDEVVVEFPTSPSGLRGTGPASRQLVAGAK